MAFAVLEKKCSVRAKAALFSENAEFSMYCIPISGCVNDKLLKAKN